MKAWKHTVNFTRDFYECSFYIILATLAPNPVPSSICIQGSINLLKPIGYVMHQQFKVQQFHALPTLCICALYFIWEQTATCATYKLTGFYNRGEKSLLRGTNWVFKYSSLRFGFKGVITQYILQSLFLDGDWRCCTLKECALMGHITIYETKIWK